MWHIRHSTLEPATFDLSGSGQAPRQFIQLVADGTLLINAMELVDWTEDATQALVCQACGFTGCKSSDWVSLRFAGDVVLIIPAFAIWASPSKGIEYAPPAYVRRRGIPCFDLITYQSMRSSCAGMPPAENLRPLTAGEAIRVFQWEAPFELFGRFPEVIRCRDGLLAGASSGDEASHARRIEDLAQSNLSSDQSVTLEQLGGAETVVSLYIDGPEFIDWRALAYESGTVCLILDSTFKLKC